MYVTMDSNQALNGINDDDVISFTKPYAKNTFCVSEFRKIIDNTKTQMKSVYSQSLIGQGHHLYSSCTIVSGGRSDSYDEWFTSGAECKLLRLGESQWKQGKVRIRVEVEFIPDDESTEIDEPSLDTFREN